MIVIDPIHMPTLLGMLDNADANASRVEQETVPLKEIARMKKEVISISDALSKALRRVEALENRLYIMEPDPREEEYQLD